MKVYIDLVLILNIYLDFLLLLVTSLILKRNISIKRIILGSLVGGLSTFLLFIEVSNILLFIYKFIFSILMILSTFSYHNFKYFFNNLIYLYLNSIVLGGGIYLLDLELNINNLLFLILGSFIILFIYLKQIKSIRNNYNNYINVEINYKNNSYKLIGYIDSGNKLYDQFKKRPISIISNNRVECDLEDVLYVPYETASGNGVIKCLKVEMKVGDILYKNSLIGFMNKEIKIDGVDVILNNEYGGIK